MTQDRIPLTRLAGELRAVIGDDAPNYTTLYRAVLNGRLPTVMKDGKHYVSGPVSDVARTLGLPVPAQRASEPVAA